MESPFPEVPSQDGRIRAPATQNPALFLKSRDPTPKTAANEFAGVHAARGSRVLPDPLVCRAKKSGLRCDTDLVDCLVPHPRECPYVMRFGDGNFCQHPLRHEIAAQTARPS